MLTNECLTWVADAGKFSSGSSSDSRFKEQGSTHPRSISQKRRGEQAVEFLTQQFNSSRPMPNLSLWTPESFDLAICMGATHAFGLGSDAYRNAILQMISLVVPGGLLRVADGYMKQSATPEYRKLLGDTIPDEMTHASNAATGKELGLIPVAAWASSDDEWDEFEWTYQRVVERKAVDKPLDEGAIEKLTRRPEWMDAYLRWGRDTLGYGIYLFKKAKERRGNG